MKYTKIQKNKSSRKRIEKQRGIKNVWKNSGPKFPKFDKITWLYTSKELNDSKFENSKERNMNLISRELWLWVLTHLLACLCSSRPGASPGLKWFPRKCLSKTFKSKRISCSHLGHRTTVGARYTINRSKGWGRKRLGKEIFGEIRFLESSCAYQRI